MVSKYCVRCSARHSVRWFIYFLTMAVYIRQVPKYASCLWPIKRCAVACWFRARRRCWLGIRRGVQVKMAKRAYRRNKHAGPRMKSFSSLHSKSNHILYMCHILCLLYVHNSLVSDSSLVFYFDKTGHHIDFPVIILLFEVLNNMITYIMHRV